MAKTTQLIDAIRQHEFAEFVGSVTSIGQTVVRADGPLCSVGELCRLGAGDAMILGEVVRVDSEEVSLIPLSSPVGLRPGAPVRRLGDLSRFRSGDGFAGRAVNGFGEPMDGGPAVLGQPATTQSQATALQKTVVAQRVSTGLRVIDTLFPIAKGQRIGIFAAAGVGKTTLVEQLSLNIDCDHVVACLVGERGREVERFWRMHREGPLKERVSLVAATSDQSASERLRAMQQALAISERWRDEGKHVVLFVDSVTRLAMALREIGLAAGEPPSVRSYTPNVFSALPAFVERCGAIKDRGAITAIFTVLSETDDVDDPIAETMKSILDGHIVLSRKLAGRGHFPAIDIAASISRVADQLLDSTTRHAARELRSNFTEYEAARPMIESGIYQEGSSAPIDRAIALQPAIADFVRQTEPLPGQIAVFDAQLAKCVSEGVS